MRTVVHVSDQADRCLILNGGRVRLGAYASTIKIGGIQDDR